MPEGLKYNIIRADKEGCPAIAGLKFTDPTEASQTARKLSREMGEKLMVKLIIDDKWKHREKTRFLNEEYRRLPWAGQDWWDSMMAIAIHRDHFAHPSKEKPGWIAYTKNAEDGMRDKQTVVRPGSYLKTYFVKVMYYYGCSERRLVEQFMAAFGPIEIKFAVTEEEIISVYERGPDTCMKGRRWPLDGRNPARIYAAGDLQVAYMGTLEKATARALVWPDKKKFSRVYGDIARITNGLERLGYKWGAPIGAKVQRVELKKVKFDPNKGPPTGCFLAPYIDKKNQAGGGHLSVIDKGDHLLICEEGLPGSHHAGLPDGYTGYYVPREDEFPTFTCEKCDTPGFRNLLSVLTEAEDPEELSWCPKCARRHAIQCAYSSAWFQIDGNKFVEVDHANWHEYYAEMYAAECEATGILTNTGNLLVVEMDGKSKKINANWAHDHGLFQSNISRKYYLGDQRLRLYSVERGAQYIGRPELKFHGFECDSCGTAWNLTDRVQLDDKLYCRNCKDAPQLPLEKRAKKPSYSAQNLYNEMMQAQAQAQNLAQPAADYAPFILNRRLGF